MLLTVILIIENLVNTLPYQTRYYIQPSNMISIRNSNPGVLTKYYEHFITIISLGYCTMNATAVFYSLWLKLAYFFWAYRLRPRHHLFLFYSLSSMPLLRPFAIHIATFACIKPFTSATYNMSQLVYKTV